MYRYSSIDTRNNEIERETALKLSQEFPKALASLSLESMMAEGILIAAAEQGLSAVVNACILAGTNIHTRAVHHEGKSAMEIAQEKNHTHIVDLLSRAAASPVYATQGYPQKIKENESTPIEIQHHIHDLLRLHRQNDSPKNLSLESESQAWMRIFTTVQQWESKSLADQTTSLEETRQKLTKNVCAFHGEERTNNLLHLAIHNNSLELARICIHAKASLSEKLPHWEGTALHLAAHLGHLEITALLIEHGADVDTRSHSIKCTPLILAIQGLHPGVVAHLIKAGANLDLRTTRGHSARQYLQHKDRFIASTIMSHGANDSAHDMALNDELLEKKAAEYAKAIDISDDIKSQRIAEYTEAQETAARSMKQFSACYAVHQRNKSAFACNYIFGRASDARATNLKKWEDLHRTEDGVKQLKKFSNELTTLFTADGYLRQVALTMLAPFGYTEFMRLCLRTGADINVPDTDGRTALILATQHQQHETMRMLLTWGADSLSRSHKDRNETAMMAAIRLNDCDAIQLLFDDNPTLGLMNANNQDEINIARACNHKKASELLYTLHHKSRMIMVALELPTSPVLKKTMLLSRPNPLQSNPKNGLTTSLIL